MGMTTINGWTSIDPGVPLILSPGDNHNLVATEYVILVPTVTGIRVTGFVPPDYDHFWLTQIANGDPTSLLTIEFPGDTGSDVGQRILMPNPLTQTKYVLAPGQVAEMIFTPNPDITKQGWYPKIPGVVA